MALYKHIVVFDDESFCTWCSGSPNLALSVGHCFHPAGLAVIDTRLLSEDPEEFSLRHQFFQMRDGRWRDFRW